MKDPQTKEFYEFGGFQLDVEKRRLWRGEELISLTPKEFELLLILVENAGRVLEKDELHERIWKDTFVEDGTLTRNISWLRKKLGDGNESGNKLIETYPKRGYRFLPEVTKGFDRNQLVIEEQRRTRIQVQETVSVTDDSLAVPAARSLVEGKVAGVRVVPRWLWLVLGTLAIAITAVVIYRNFFVQKVPQVVIVSNLTPFSSLTGRESLPAFSPDGKMIAFIWNGGEGDLSDVYVRLIGAGDPIRITNNERNSLFPVFSPDGKYIAFSRSFSDTSSIYLSPALGGAERKIAEVTSGGTSFSFSPDGKTIAVADKDSASAKTGIFLVNIESGAKQRITTPPENLYDHDPRFSPDGKLIAFLRSVNNVDKDLFITSVTGVESPRRLTVDHTQIRGFTWTANGQNIILSSLRGQASSPTLWQIPISGGEPIPIVTNG